MTMNIITVLYYQSLEGDEAFSMALRHPHRYVLKAEGEGGGNSVQGAEEVTAALDGMRESRRRDAHILMDRIDTPVAENYLVGWWGFSCAREPLLVN